MNFIKTPISDLLIIEPRLWADERGHFFESYSKKCFEDAGIHADFVQDNESLSHKGVLRGLHAQKEPFAQGKLVRVIRGKVLDVAVDIRKKSQTFGQYFRVELSADNHRMFWVPPGFLHGFVALEDNTIFNYKVTSFYHKESEVGIAWNDPDLAVDWALTEDEMIISEKDRVLPFLKDTQNPF